MIWVKIILIILVFIAHIIIGYEIPHIKNKNSYEKIKEFHKIIRKENKDESDND